MGDQRGKLTLRDLRLRAGLSRREMAIALGCGVSTYANWEAGRRTPSLADALAICDLFGVDPRDIDWQARDGVLKAAAGE